MTDEQINITIAEACGQTEALDYCNDLRAMIEAELYIARNHGDRKWRAYCDRIPFRATARQRAEAFLKIIGKWIA